MQYRNYSNLCVCNVVSYRRVCEYDMCARGSTTDYRPLCTALAEMASACYELGLKVEWMSHPPIAALCHMDNGGYTI